MSNILKRPFRYRYFNAVLLLIGVNILVYMGINVMRNGRMIVYLSLIPGLVASGWLWQLATYMFVHGSGSHLFFNMLGLYIFGSQVEQRLGSAEFLLYYFVTGTLAGVFSFAVYWFTGSNVILMGASGALFAVQLAYAALFPRSVLFLWGILPLRAPVMVLGYTALELLFTLTGRSGGVAHLTHLAGFGFGWLYFLVRYGVNPWREMRG